MRARAIVPIVVLASLLMASVADHALAGTRSKVRASVNAIRKNHGLRRLDCTRGANRVAQRNSREMAGARYMSHSSNLYSRLRNRGIRASAWAENVGYAPRWRRVVRMWMRSSAHRHNILGRYRRCGVGAVRSSGVVWITFVFYRN